MRILDIVYIPLNSKLWLKRLPGGLAALLTCLFFFIFPGQYSKPGKHFANLRSKYRFSNLEYLKYNHVVYSKIVKARYERLDAFYQGDLDKIVPWDGLKATYLWDFFPPAWNCPWRERMGRFSEGGKVVCNVDALDWRDAVIYSYGVRDDISFESALVDRTNVTVHAFDPTVDGLPYKHPQIKFYKQGLSPTTNGSLESIEHTMKKLGHDTIDLLKVDCEGCEWEAFRTNKAQSALKNVNQLLIELHYKQHSSNVPGNESHVKDVFEFFDVMEKSGLYPFSWEVNHNPSGYFNQKPWAIEYSFVRWNSKYMLPYGKSMLSLKPKENILGIKGKEEQHKPAIVYLANADDRDVENLMKSVALLVEAFPEQEIPILFFYDDVKFLDYHKNISRSLQMKEAFISRIEFVYVDLSVPDGCCNFEPSSGKRTKFGYHNMIRFWIKDVWHSKAIRDGRITHVMRLDTDSYLGEVQTDATPDLPEGVLYRGNTMKYDSLPTVVQGFYEFVKSQINGTQPKNSAIIKDILDSWEASKMIPMIYNNFFIATVEFFQRPEVVEMVEKICCSAPEYYVYRHRWGDAIIHNFLLGMFANKKEIILNAPARGYSHG